MKKLFTLLFISLEIIFSVDALAAEIWAHDSAGNIAKVNTSNGQATIVGNTGFYLTDLAVDANNNLYGINFDTLYAVDKNTAKATRIGKLSSVNDANSLVFDKAGNFYSAGNITKNIYSIDVKTGTTKVVFNTGYSSGGDLAYLNNKLYYTDGVNLISLDLTAKTATRIGLIGPSNVYGLVNGGDGVLYAMANTEVYSVNTTTGAGTLLASWKTSPAFRQVYGGTVMGESNPNGNGNNTGTNTDDSGNIKPKIGEQGPIGWREIITVPDTSQIHSGNAGGSTP